MNKSCILVFVILFVPFLILADLPKLNLPKLDKKATKLPPCKLCSALVASFVKGMVKTARGKHDGGDAVWEEQRMRSYKNSEVRLVEILESLCRDLERGEDQCHSLAEAHEHLIEKWWFKEQDDHPDFYTWLCIENNNVCCPSNHFGPNCEPCTDCNGNGICKGNGTRKGNGKCACDDGYKGETCNECAIQYYESFRDENKLLCSQCHIACEDDSGCTSAGPKGCRVCKQGWIMQPDLGGCIDIDECATDKHKCTKNQFCVNSEGSFKCLECDKSCDGCTGDGPDLCNECTDGYELRDGLCKEPETENNVEEETPQSNDDDDDDTTKDEL